MSHEKEIAKNLCFMLLTVAMIKTKTNKLKRAKIL
jgi:hypothetical protein